MGWIRSGMVWGLWLGTPCSSFSRARRAPAGSRMPQPLRSSDAPRGLPELAERDAAVVADGNLLAARSAALTRAAYEQQVPGGEENPHSSFLWLLPSWRAQERLENASDHIFDQCAFGRPFRARTRLRLWHCHPGRALHEKQCRGRGICSFSHKPHLQLTGVDKKAFRTATKAEYPPGLAAALADTFVTAYMAKRSARMWNLMQ